MTDRFVRVRSALRRAATRGARVLAAALLMATGLMWGTAFGPRPTAAATTAPKAYIGLYGDNAIGVLDTATGHMLKTIKVPAGPEAVVLTPDGRTVYVSSEDATDLSVIDTDTDQVAKTLPLGESPQGMALSRDARTLLVAVFGTNKVDVVDTSTLRVTAQFTVAKPHGVALSPDGRTAYVGAQDAPNNNAIVVLDVAGRRVVATLALDKTPRGLTVSPDGKSMYFSLAGSDAIQVLDTATNRIATQITVGAVPHQIAFTPDRKYALVIVQGINQLAIIDVASRQVIKDVAVGKFPHWVGLTSDGALAYVTNEGANTVSVVDMAKQQVVATIPVGNAPRKITLQRGSGAMSGYTSSAAAVAPIAAQAPQATGAGAQIHIKNFAYGPVTVTVGTGQQVTWVNDDAVPHTATAAGKQWDSGQLAPGSSFTVTMTKPGTYVYNCEVHPFMQAKVVVTP
ncbi:MAG TPA: cupredoxin domain-containing protein [bacterium]|nr:cupredoxin domain-containing protein [bacterium]